MADSVSKEKRSQMMAKVGQKDTPQELAVRKALWARGFRFRKNVKSLPGSPDIVLPKYKTVIFVHGCFWHGHNCQAGRLPKTNVEFWIKKIEGNKNRDKLKNKQLEKLGWTILEVWQCQLSSSIRQEQTLEKLIKSILPIAS